MRSPSDPRSRPARSRPPARTAALGFATLVGAAAIFASGCAAPSTHDVDPAFASTAMKPKQAIAFPPRTYDAPRVEGALVLDGKLDDPAWARAAWSTEFGDIQGPALPMPRHATRMKMLWDDEYLYIAADMDEPDLWATLVNRDEIVYYDNDFEIFIDPDGDTREYYELEVNVFGTIFDLYLHTAYRDGGPAEHGWDCEGLVTAIAARGTINDNRDHDDGWSLEWAIPWSSLTPPTTREDGSEWTLEPFTEQRRGARAPAPGSSWRINFSRVQWRLEEAGVGYRKVEGAPEDNWTWTPQWEINMHVPQHWGYVRFMP